MIGDCATAAHGGQRPPAIGPFDALFPAWHPALAPAAGAPVWVIAEPWAPPTSPPWIPAARPTCTPATTARWSASGRPGAQQLNIYQPARRSDGPAAHNSPGPSGTVNLAVRAGAVAIAAASIPLCPQLTCPRPEMVTAYRPQDPAPADQPHAAERRWQRQHRPGRLHRQRHGARDFARRPPAANAH